MMADSMHVRCKCKKNWLWVEDGRETRHPCPSCGRNYIGKYNRSRTRIIPIQVRTKTFLGGGLLDWLCMRGDFKRGKVK